MARADRLAEGNRIGDTRLAASDVSALMRLYHQNICLEKICIVEHLASFNVQLVKMHGNRTF